MYKPNDNVDAYFASMNSMSKRIVMDFMSMQQSYGEKWNKLSYADQCDLITKEFLKPAITEKYPNVASEEESCFPKLKINCGEKYVYEEGNGTGSVRKGRSWRDEHSGPFIWESQSQLNLSYILQESPTEATDDDKILIANEDEDGQSKLTQETSKEGSTHKSESRPKSTHSKRKPAPPIPVQIVKSEETSDVTQGKNDDAALSPVLQETIVSSASSGSEMFSAEEGNDIPKTGFDFLDNW